MAPPAVCAPSPRNSLVLGAGCTPPAPAAPAFTAGRGSGRGDRQALTVGIKPGSDPRDDPGEGMQGAPRVAQGKGRTRPVCLGPRLPLQEVRAGEPGPAVSLSPKVPGAVMASEQTSVSGGRSLSQTILST